MLSQADARTLSDWQPGVAIFLGVVEAVDDPADGFFLVLRESLAPHHQVEGRFRIRQMNVFPSLDPHSLPVIDGRLYGRMLRSASSILKS